MAVTEINLVVSDLDRSKDFYEALGWTFRAITLPGVKTAVAWLTVEGLAPVTIHTVEFAAWWDPSGPAATPGSTTIDVELDSPGALDRFVVRAAESGATVTAEPRDMPWGQRYAIVADPDGYRWGLKSEPADQ
jgi:catechol 2,3-dioxygenase-like lactoylglutathione lyase family enzyme